mmetsp:Transcript_3361/g.6420  ORF Transcript_3361/g.6420 Transcript_3361/m.6420 type:complete len:236 (-) Transcript_3361:310-1017(-)
MVQVHASLSDGHTREECIHKGCHGGVSTEAVLVSHLLEQVANLPLRGVRGLAHHRGCMLDIGVKRGRSSVLMMECHMVRHPDTSVPHGEGCPYACDRVVGPVVASSDCKVARVMKCSEAPLNLEPSCDKSKDHSDRGGQASKERERIAKQVHKYLCANLERPGLVRFYVGGHGLVHGLVGGTKLLADTLREHIVEPSLFKGVQGRRSTLYGLLVLNHKVLLQFLLDSVTVCERVV